ncbi:RDD family protein [Halorussus sp. MSC15.2]|uniref:RDD family protein n=1 Tax=Halorussus sp. MSC15.2 TaxID=2283638 RepID=UPI0013D5C276|nr:RDD family protein [Halorussus sp. MSC15.2]NEU57880.1 RDD family protein [Halorussus sp. MSC15.2]
MQSAHVETATVRERVTAYLADAVVVGATVVGVAVGLGDSRRERRRLGALLGLAVANLYHVVLEGTGGQTAGKRAVGIAVAGDDGERPSYASAATRTAFRFVDWLPVGYLLGLASIALTERRKRLGDLAANTVVVRTDSDADADERGA